MSARLDDVPASGFGWAVRDSLNESRRHLIAMPRNVEMMVVVLLQPLMFVLLFRYVFGGAITVPDMSYTQFLLPGIFAQSVVFGSTFTGVGLAEDMQKGFIDRLRSMPISRSAVLIGRTLSDLVRNLLSFLGMLVVAFLIGFRFDGGLLRGLGATALLIAFSHAFSWVQAPIGLMVKSVETANSAGFIWMFPLTFVSSAYVPTDNMSPWLRRVADANPFTIVTNAARALYNGRDPGNDVWLSLAWAAGIIVVFATISMWLFARSTSR